MTRRLMNSTSATQNRAQSTPGSERGFSLTELMIALMVFALITGSVVMLLVKSQGIFRTEQGVADMDQNARLMMDFLTRDIQQSKENGLGIGAKFRSVFSYNGPNGMTDELTIVSADTDSRIPAAALPLVPAATAPFSVSDRYVEVMPNSIANEVPADVISTFAPGEQFMISTVLESGAVQFDIVQVAGARLVDGGAIGVTLEPMTHRGVESEIPFGSKYEAGFTMRPIEVKRYFVDSSKDSEHPEFGLSINDGPALEIARNVVGFQLRYLEVRDGDSDGNWVQRQTIDENFKTVAVEVTLTARTDKRDDSQTDRLVTLASVIRPRTIPDFGSPFGSIASGRRSPGPPTDGGGVGGGPGDGSPGGAGIIDGTGDAGSGGTGTGSSGFGSGGYGNQTRHIKPNGPRLGERLNRPR